MYLLYRSSLGGKQGLRMRARMLDVGAYCPVRSTQGGNRREKETTSEQRFVFNIPTEKRVRRASW